MNRLSVIALAVIDPLSTSWNLLTVGGAILVVAILALIWVGYRHRHSRRRRKRRHRHGHGGDSSGRMAKPTLAQTGGLPPVRSPNPANGPKR